MKREHFLEYINNLYSVFSGEKNPDILLKLEDEIAGTLIEKGYRIALNQAIQAILNQIKIPKTKIPVNSVIKTISNITGKEEEKNTILAENAYKEGLDKLKINNIKDAGKCFQTSRIFFLKFVQKDIDTHPIFILIHNLNPNNFEKRYHNKLELHCTRSLIASLLEAYCCQKLDNKSDLKMRLEDCQLLFYLRLFYLENSLGIEEVKNQINNKYLKYTIESDESDAGNIYSEIKEEENVFINLLEEIFNYKVPKSLGKQPYIERVESRHPSSGVVDIRSRTSFNLMPYIFKTDHIFKKCWARNLENSKNN